jgi:hypothetical protein
LAVRASTRAPLASSVAARGLEWLPALSAAAYVATVAVSFPALVRALYWNSDAAGAFTLADLYNGHGHVEIPRFGWWSSLWWLLATRNAPGHAQLWEITGYAFALAGAAIVGWVTWRIAGRWAGVAAAAIAVAVGPAALYPLLTVNFHTSTPFTAVVLGGYLVALRQSSSWLLAVAVGVLAGVNAASDPLLWVAGVGPFVVGAAVLVFASRRRDAAVRAAVTLGVITVGFFATGSLMRAVGFHVHPVGVHRAGVHDLAPNIIKLGKSIAQVFGANHFFPGVYPDPALRYAITLLAFAGVGGTVFVAARLIMRRAEPTVRAYASYWAASAVLLGIAFCVTNQGTGVGPGGGVNYLLSLAPATAVGVALLAAPSYAGRVAVSLAVAFIGAVNVAGVAAGRAEKHAGAETYGTQLVRLIESKGVTHGYAGYWDAHSLTWKSGLRVVLAPVQACPDAHDTLCRFHLGFTVDSWYDERPGPSVLIVDPPAWLAFTPPPSLGKPYSTERFGPNITVYFFRHDLARHVR